MTDARSLIMGTSSPAMAFNYRGDKIVGKITTEPKAVQQTVYDPNNPTRKEPAFWPSGDPKMQVIFQVETQWRNYEGINNPDRTKPDNGVRTIYLKGKHMERATADAIRAAGADWLEVGGMISFEYTGDDLTSKAGIKPKLFAVKYKAPDVQPQHFQQYGNAAQAPAGASYGANGMAGQGYQAQNAPRPPQQDWNAAQAYARHQQAQQVITSPPMTQDPWATPTPLTPPHHGTENSMPDWAAGPTSAPPASPSSAPPAVSTLEMIRNAGQTNMPGFDSDGSGTPDF